VSALAAARGSDYQPAAGWEPWCLIGLRRYRRPTRAPWSAFFSFQYRLFDHPFRFSCRGRPVGLVCHVYEWPEHERWGRTLAPALGLVIEQLNPCWSSWNRPATTPLLWTAGARIEPLAKAGRA
jgi:hypothetical protein